MKTIARRFSQNKTISAILGAMEITKADGRVQHPAGKGKGKLIAQLSVNEDLARDLACFSPRLGGDGNKQEQEARHHGETASDESESTAAGAATDAAACGLAAPWEAIRQAAIISQPAHTKAPPIDGIEAQSSQSAGHSAETEASPCPRLETAACDVHASLVLANRATLPVSADLAAEKPQVGAGVGLPNSGPYTMSTNLATGGSQVLAGGPQDLTQDPETPDQQCDRRHEPEIRNRNQETTVVLPGNMSAEARRALREVRKEMGLRYPSANSLRQQDPSNQGLDTFPSNESRVVVDISAVAKDDNDAAVSHDVSPNPDPGIPRPDSPEPCGSESEIPAQLVRRVRGKRKPGRGTGHRGSVMRLELPPETSYCNPPRPDPADNPTDRTTAATSRLTSRKPEHMTSSVEQRKVASNKQSAHHPIHGSGNINSRPHPAPPGPSGYPPGGRGFRGRYRRENTFQITPPGYDSRFSDVPPLLLAAEDDTPTEIKLKAVEKCNEWLSKYSHVV